MKLLHLASLGALPALVAGTAVASAASYSPPTALVAGVPQLAFRDLGQAPAGPIRLAIVLQYQHPSELRAFVVEQPGLLPAYRALSAQQFRDYFAPSPQTYARTISTLEQLGLRVVQTYANRTVIDVEAPAPVVDRVFATTIHAVAQQGVPAQAGRAGIAAGVRYANLRPAVLPAQLRSAVFGIEGFNNLTVLRPAYVRPEGRVHTGVALGPPVYGPDGGYGPYAFADAYNYPVQYQVRGGSPGQTYDGTGQATGNVIDSDFLDSDLSGFLSYFGITRDGPATHRVEVDGGAGINGDTVETTLDVETIVGTSPGTALYVYIIPAGLYFNNIIDAYNRIVSDDIVDAANSSFGGCENQAGSFPQNSDQIAMQGEADGINFTASTGDDGSSCYGGSGVNTPASGPHFLAMGGTTLNVNSNGSYGSESGWSGSGGGVSEIFTRPSYQNGIQNIQGSTRNIPDLAFDANPYTGASFYLDGYFQGPIGGTSLSSPLMASLVTQFDQFNGSRFADLHPTIYGGYKKVGYRVINGNPVFRDVIGGSNGMYQCIQGYDLVTGIGSMDGWGAADAYKPGPN